MKKLKWSIRPDWWLVLLLVISLTLRVVLARHGGAMFLPDESRYGLAREALNTLIAGDSSKALEATFSRADHLGFRVIMMGPALLQRTWNLNYSTIAIISSGLPSVISIVLAYGIVRRLGGPREEARWTALFMAVTNSLFYWSRHILPYDMALCLALSSLFVGVHPKPGWHRSLLAGLLGFYAFITYNGYWTTVGVVLVVHVLRGWPSIWQLLLRSVLGAIGLFAPMLGMLWWAAGRNYPLIESYYTFSESINQGDFSDGHRVILEYLWYSERGLVVIWLLCIGYFVVTTAGRKADGIDRAWIGLGCVIAIAASLVWYSNVEQQFVVYGRLIRQMAPFFSILSGWAVADCCAMFCRWKWLRPALAFSLGAVGAFNFSIPLSQDWDFAERAIQFRDDYRRKSGASEADRIPLERFRLVVQEVIWPVPKQFVLPPHDVLLSGQHLLQFDALLYEGYNREQRAAIRAADISNRLILLRK